MKYQGPSVSNVTTWEDLRRYTDINFQRLLTVLSGNLVFGDNLAGTTPLDFQVTAANQVVQVNFNLPYVPKNYLVTFQDANAVIFAANVAQYPWTQTAGYVTASAAVKGRIIFF